MSLKVLDLFCGMGGWSEGFAMEGFECVGVDVVNVGYPYQLVLADVETLNGKRFKDFDVIVGSPPCRDFSKLAVCFGKKWKNPPDPMGKGIELVYAFLRIIKEANPRFWIMENVNGLRKYLNPPDIQAWITQTWQRCFWGDFPNLILPMVLSKKNVIDIHGVYRSYARAKIPSPISKAFAEGIKRELLSA